MPAAGIQAAAVLGALLCLGVALLQALLAAGRPLGEYAWGGRNRVLPGRLRVASALAAPIHLAFALALPAQAGLLATPVPARALDLLTGVLAGLFGVGILPNAVSRSRKERLVMTPVAALLCAVCWLLARAG